MGTSLLRRPSICSTWKAFRPWWSRRKGSCGLGQIGAVLLEVLLLCGLLGLLTLLYRHRRAQREAERTLYRSRKQYESVVENVEGAIFQLDQEGRWSFLNPAWTDITGSPSITVGDDPTTRSCIRTTATP